VEASAHHVPELVDSKAITALIVDGNEGDLEEIHYEKLTFGKKLG